MTPAETAALASAEAEAWISVAPYLIDVLSWHQGLCGECGLERKCGEYVEILVEYGAGPYGATVFYPLKGRDRDG